jgi:hypothetical protein
VRRAADPTTITVSHQGPVANLRIQWLPSNTSLATTEVARAALVAADHEYRVGAWLSAETSAWEALRLAAEAVDQRDREMNQQQTVKTSAVDRLRMAKQAIMEARDFAKSVESQTPESIRRIARSHQTKLTASLPSEGLTAREASDCYLDHARSMLSTITADSSDAAQASDLLAAIYLKRDDPRTLPSATALCLRRAALQGQPGNASLAENLGIHLMHVGLTREAQWALEHAMSIEPSPTTAAWLATALQRNGFAEDASALLAATPAKPATNANSIRIPEITELSPQEFAAVSQSVIWSPGQSTNHSERSDQTAPPKRPQLNAITASARMPNATAQNPTAPQPAVPATLVDPTSPVAPGAWERLKNSWKQLTAQ